MSHVVVTDDAGQPLPPELQLTGMIGGAVYGMLTDLRGSYSAHEDVTVEWTERILCAIAPAVIPALTFDEDTALAALHRLQVSVDSVMSLLPTGTRAWQELSDALRVSRRGE